MKRILSTCLLALLAVVTACQDEAQEMMTPPTTTAYAVTGTPNKQDWKQCRNDHSYDSMCQWITGNLNATHNTYAETDFVPKVLRIPGIEDNGQFQVVMTYGFLKGGLTTHDFLGYWKEDMTMANPCTDGSFTGFCAGGLGGTLNAITASSDPTGPNSIRTLSLAAVTAACSPARPQMVADMQEAIIAQDGPDGAENGELIIEGINVSDIEVTGISIDGCPVSGDAEATMTLLVTPNNTGVTSGHVLLLFGAHVAATYIWDNGGAAGVSGSPYHLGLISVDGESAGSMDLQMAANAIQPPEPAVAITIGSDGTNEVGDDHTVTGTVTTQSDAGEPFLAAADGTQIDFTIESGPGSLDMSSCTTTGGTGQCSVTLTSDAPGTTVVSASSTVGGLTATTDGIAPNSGNLTKVWVDATISIGVDGLNPVGQAHTFTVTVLQNLGDGGGFVAASGVTVTVSENGVGDITAENCSTTGTNTSGQCTVTVNSSVVGSSEVSASATIPVGGVNLSRSTDASTTPSGAQNSGPATKTWGSAWITIGNDDTNEVGNAHTFTVTVYRDTGSGTETVEDVDVTTSLTAATTTGSITGGTCETGDTDGSGQCTVTVSSNNTGQAVVSASANVPIDGTTIAVSTNGTSPNSGPATKTWVDARIEIGTSGTNAVGDPHTFTVTVEKDIGDGNGFVAASGETVTVTENGVGNLTGGSCTTTSLGAAGDPQTGTGPTNASGQCTATVNSNAAGQSTVSASVAVTIDGVTLNRSTDGSSTSGNPNSNAATKDWVTAQISIAGSATNRVGESHTFTVTVQENTGNGFVAASGETVSAFVVSNNTGIADNTLITGGTCLNGGATAADGTCTIVVNSSAAGQVVMGASSTVQVAGIGVTTSINSVTSPFGTNAASGPATKTWVDAKISIAEDGLNPLGEPHTFTVTIMKDLGDGSGYVAASGENVTASQTGGTTGTFLNNTCQTDGSGQCTIQVNSSSEGSMEVTASATLTILGLSVPVSTNGVAPNSGPATKTWFEICAEGDRVVLVGLRVTAISGATEPVDFEAIDGNGQNARFILDSSPGAVSVGDEFTLVPDGPGDTFQSQNLRFRINGQDATGTIHLSCSDDPEIGDVHVITMGGISVTLEKISLFTAPKN